MLEINTANKQKFHKGLTSFTNFVVLLSLGSLYVSRDTL